MYTRSENPNDDGSYDILDDGSVIASVTTEAGAESILGYLNAGGREMRFEWDGDLVAILNDSSDAVAYTKSEEDADILISHTNR